MTAVLLCLLLTSCTTMATIRTQPPGARVYVNGRFVGRSPVQVELKDGFAEGTYYRVKLQKERYEPQETKLEQHWSVGGIILDALLVLPTLTASIGLGYFNAIRHCDEYGFTLVKSPAVTDYAGPQEIGD